MRMIRGKHEKIRRLTVTALLVAVLIVGNIQIVNAEEPAKIPITAAQYDSELFFMDIESDPQVQLPAPEVYLRYGVRGFLPVAGDSITWDVSSIDMNTPGRQLLTGEIAIPDGYVWYEDGVESDYILKVPVFLYKQGMKPIEDLILSTYSSRNSTIALNSTADEVTSFIEANRLPTVKLRTADNLKITGDFDFTHHISKIDTSKRGCYQPFEYDTPPGTKVSDDSIEASGFAVVDPDIVDFLNMRKHPALQNTFVATWLYEATDLSVEYLKDADPLDASDSDWQDWKPATAYSDEVSIFFAPDSEPGTYYFRGVYDGGRRTDMVKIVLGDDYSFVSPIEGDKDGGDTGRQDPPDLEQDAPEQDGKVQGQDQEVNGDSGNSKPGRSGDSRSENNACSDDDSDSLYSNLKERSTGDFTEITGGRLKELMDIHPGGVLFSKGDMSLTLSTQHLGELDIMDDDIFRVDLKKTGEGTYEIGVSVNGADIGRIPDSDVRDANTFSGGRPDEREFEVYKSGTDETAAVALYEKEVNSLSFTVHETGSYELDQAAQESTAVILDSNSPLAEVDSGLGAVGAVVISLFVLAAGIAAAIIIRRRFSVRGA